MPLERLLCGIVYLSKDAAEGYAPVKGCGGRAGRGVDRRISHNYNAFVAGDVKGCTLGLESLVSCIKSPCQGDRSTGSFAMLKGLPNRLAPSGLQSPSSGHHQSQTSTV